MDFGYTVVEKRERERVGSLVWSDFVDEVFIMFDIY